MVGDSHQAQDLAVQLLGYSRNDALSHEDLSAAVTGAFDTLRAHLSVRLGSEGYRTLLIRAVALARTEYPWFAVLQVDDEARLNGFAEAARATDLGSAFEAGVLLISCLVGLLQIFIGDDMTLNLLQNALPDSAGSKESNNE